jgi:hypothetical protein
MGAGKSAMPSWQAIEIEIGIEARLQAFRNLKAETIDLDSDSDSDPDFDSGIKKSQRFVTGTGAAARLTSGLLVLTEHMAEHTRHGGFNMA